MSVAVVDAPSDRETAPFLGGFRQTPEHVADIKAVIAWLKQQANVPVWLVGTSMGTLSAAFIATQVGPGDGGPDGLVLTSTILSLDGGRPVPAMPLQKITVPVLVVHHEKDGCKLCAYSEIPRLMEKLSSTPRKELVTFKGEKIAAIHAKLSHITASMDWKRMLWQKSPNGSGQSKPCFSDFQVNEDGAKSRAACYLTRYWSLSNCNPQPS